MTFKRLISIQCAILMSLLLAAPVLAGSTHTDKNLEKLVRHFEEQGTDISPLLDDARFKLIKDITGKFKRAVEIKIEGIEDYKGVIKFEKKKGLIGEFSRKYAAELQNAEETYDIPQSVIIGILGVESEYGTYAGSYNPFNAYVSMYVEEYRQKWALAQLEELLEFAENRGMDVLDMKSSYAGAMSYAQFIPWSLNRYWVGTDLYHMPNNINSVANYLAHYRDVTGSVEKAILRYNPSSLYQQAVLALAEEAKAQGIGR